MLNIEKTERFLNELTDIIKESFPNSCIFWRKGEILGKCYYHIHFYLAHDKEELSSGILLNDPLNWTFSIDTAGVDGCLPEDIVISLYSSTIIRAADKSNPKEKYCVYGGIKVPFRKIKGNTETCKIKMKRFIERTEETIIQNAETINAGIIKGYFTVETKIKQAVKK